jgi:hypothetical protein
MRFTTTVLNNDKTATGIEIPAAVVDGLGAGKRPKVYVTINDYTYRSSIAVMNGKFMVGISAENRAACHVGGGDVIAVEITVDNDVRRVDVPKELARALNADRAAKAKYEALSYSNQLRHALAVSTAKTEETRQRRLASVLAALQP